MAGPFNRGDTHFTFTIALIIKQILPILAAELKEFTRVILKVLSMVVYLSNRFTKSIIVGIILKSHLSSMLWHKFHGGIKMQTRKV